MLVPTYNSARYLPAALDSILAQTFRDYEVIVIDDGSTDDTAGALRPYRERIRYEYHANRGIGETRNRALQLAAGELVAFLDADDLWDADHLATKVAALDALPGAAGVFGEFRLIDGADAVVTTAGTAMQFKVFERESLPIEEAFTDRGDVVVGGRSIAMLWGNIFDTLFLGNFILPTSLVMRRAPALAIGPFTSMRTQEDYEYLLRLARHQVLGFVPAPQVSYRRHSDQLTSFARIESVVRGAASIIDHYEAEFRANGRRAGFDRRKAGLCSALGTLYLRQGRIADARANIGEAIRRAPLDWHGYAHYALSLIPYRMLAAWRGW